MSRGDRVSWVAAGWLAVRLRDPVLLRYVALQVPGWILTCVVLAGLRHWVDLSFGMAAGLFGLLLLKDIVIYPFVRSAYATDAQHGTDLLIGMHGVVTGPIGVSGYVRMRGELWRAESQEMADEIPAGVRVVVESARGLTLIVRRTDEEGELAARTEQR